AEFVVGGGVIDAQSESTNPDGPIACGVTLDGKLDCFVNGPLALAVPDGTFEHVAVGTNNVCAIRDDHTLACFDSGPTDAPAGAFQQVSVGWSEACALDTDGAVTCWELNTGTLVSSPSGAFEQVVVISEEGVGAADSEACGLSGGALECWDAYGQRELRGPFKQFAPNTDQRFGEQYLLRPDGSIVTSAENPSEGTFYVSEHEAWGSGFLKLGVGQKYAYALAVDGSVVAITLRDDTATLLPIAGPEEQLVDISVGRDFVCGLRRDGNFRCFGSIVH
ncbi:MAG TPA: hypothetical protein VGQ57_17105, partial [Polyangiaceae bacterium]|nr:hypothetical protein [Polyangiaceae bacterium]